MEESLVEVVNLKKYFKTPKGLLHAVDGVNFKIDKSKTLGVVGESGCGKSTLGRLILRLCEPTDGDILYKKNNILNYNRSQVKNLRQQMQIIFQDPYSSLNPRLTVFEIISEPIICNHKYRNKNEIYKKVYKVMDLVNLSKKVINLYPHELDGGRRQHVGIARALVLNPEFIVCDEPVSALDVSIQAQILNLLMDLQDNIGLTYMFITHDLSVVKHISNDILVMYLGQAVESAPQEELFHNPKHPYTRALLDAIPLPVIKKKKDRKEVLRGEVKNPINPLPGCRFEDRCPFVREDCREGTISLTEISKKHFVACRLFE